MLNEEVAWLLRFGHHQAARRDRRYHHLVVLHLPHPVPRRCRWVVAAVGRFLLLAASLMTS